MFRCLKMETKSKQRCFGMMTAAEQSEVVGVLDIMNCGPAPEDGSQESVSEPPPLVLALTDAPADARPGAASPVEDITLDLTPRPSLHRSKQLDPMQVFDRVLSRVSSEEAESDDLPGESSSSRAPPHATASTGSPVDMRFSYLLSQAEAVEPLDNKAQLIIFRKNCPEKKKGKGKGQQKGEANKNKKTEANKKTEIAKITKSKSKSKVTADESLDSKAPEISQEKDKIQRSPRPTRSQSLSSRTRKPRLTRSRPRKPRRARRRHRNPRRSRTPRPVLTRIRRRRPSRPTPRRRPRSSPRMSMMVQTRRRIRLRWIEQPSGNELSPKPTTTREIGR